MADDSEELITVFVDSSEVLVNNLLPGLFVYRHLNVCDDDDP